MDESLVGSLKPLSIDIVQGGDEQRRGVVSEGRGLEEYVEH
jgi:hypothetical protein